MSATTALRPRPATRPALWKSTDMTTSKVRGRCLALMAAAVVALAGCVGPGESVATRSGKGPVSDADIDPAALGMSSPSDGHTERFPPTTKPRPLPALTESHRSTQSSP